MKRVFAAAALALGLAFGAAAPAEAILHPSVTLTYASPIGGDPGAGRFVMGYITFGPTDTYTTGGFLLTPAALGLGNRLIAVVANATVQINATGTAQITFAQQMQGTAGVTAGQTTAVVNVAAAIGNNALTPNTPILCALDNAATAGGGSGTWATTAGVSSCAYTSATSFTITTTAAAPSNGGNVAWFAPTVAMEMAPGTPMGSVVLPFFVTGL